MAGEHWVLIVLIICVFVFLTVVAWKRDPDKTQQRPKIELPTWTYTTTTHYKDGKTKDNSDLT